MTQVLPLYAQLKDAIIHAVSSGELAAGNQIPSQRELCEKYGMSHMTVRRAINELINEGVVYAIPGKGIFVSPVKVNAEAGPLVSFTEEMARLGMRVTSKVLTAELVSASSILARGLGVEVGALLVHLERLRLADGQSMAVQTTYLPHNLCLGLLGHDLEQQSLYALLRSVYDLRLNDSTSVVEAAMASKEQASLLGVPWPSAVLVTEQITFLDNGKAIEFVRTIYRSDLYRLKVR
jgi:GntR family transcriptional regulator